MPATATGPAGPGAPEPLLKSLQALLHDVPGLFTDRVELLTLELQRAGQALAQIVVLLIVAAVLGVTTWLVLWATLVIALLAAGLGWVGACLLVVVVNLAATALAVARVRRLLPRLRLSATRRHLLPRPAPGADSNEPRGDPNAPTAPTAHEHAEAAAR
jgi:uncharacterized membrane protein YqjE